MKLKIISRKSPDLKMSDYYKNPPVQMNIFLRIGLLIVAIIMLVIVVNAITFKN